MTSSIVLINDIADVNYCKNLELSSSKIFSFNIYVHKSLEKEQITHEIAEHYLNNNDRLNVFDTTVSLYDWYKKNTITDNVRLEGVNIFGILDTAELHLLLIKTLYDFLVVKRILEKEKPQTVIASASLAKLVRSLMSDKNIDLEIIHTSDSKPKLAWDTIEIKFNLGKIPLSFHLSRSRYNKIKNLFESSIGTILGLWFDFKDNKQSILLLEFNSSSYHELLQNLGKFDRNVVLLNRRRSAIWNFESIKYLIKNRSKIINFKKILSNQEKKHVESIIKEYDNEIDKIWNHDFLNGVFSFEGYSFWPCIRDLFAQTYKQRLPEYVNFVLEAKKILQKAKISCIVSLNIVGETEKIILDLNKNLIPSIMLEHGYANYTKEITRYDILSMYPLLRDKIAVWGQVQKQYLMSQHGLDEKRILVTGSPKHDSFFKIEHVLTHKNKVILLTIHPITEITGQTDTDLYIKFETVVREFCKIIKNLDSVKILVKLHPGQDRHNADIKTLFKEIDSGIPVYQLTPISKLMQQCDVVVNMSSEGFDPSTVIFEAMLMKKPIMNIVLDGQLYDFQYVKDNAVLTVSDMYELDKNLKNILYDDDVRAKLIENSAKHLKNYLSYPGSASESFAKILASY